MRSMRIWIRMANCSLTQLARFYRDLFTKVDISTAGERALWQSSITVLPPIKDPAYRIADVGPYLDFLEERLRIARTEEIRETLESMIKRLRQQVEKLQSK